MDSQHQKFTGNSSASQLHDPIRSTEFSSDSQQNHKDSDTDMEKEEIVRIMKRTAANLHSAASFNASNTFNMDMVHSSNHPETHKELDRILASHFYSLNLTNSQSVIIFLLLSCFLLKKENKETEVVRKLYEDHISLLKEKNLELEEKAAKQSSGSSRDCSQLSSPGSDSCDELKKKLESNMSQVAQLQQSYDEVCHINTQWALDYETLSKQIKDSTGFHSVSTSSTSSSSSSSNESTAMHTASLMTSASSCMHCSIYASQLEDRAQEADILTAELIGLKEDVNELKERLSQKQQAFSCMEREYQMIRLQIQEIGDLQQALNMKYEYRKLHHSLQQKTKLYQDAVGEKMHLQNQVEKLRQAFLRYFPFTTPIQGPPTSMTTRPPQGGSYSSFPPSCRHNIQSTALDNTPPTPPGLLARGDMRGGNVEKDDQLTPHIKLEHDCKTRRKSYEYSNAKQSRSLDHLDSISGSLHVPHTSHNHIVADHVTKTDVGMKTSKSMSLSPSVLRLSDFGSTDNMAAIAPPRERLRSNSSNEITHQSQVACSHSGSSTSHTGSSHRSLVPTHSIRSYSGNPVAKNVLAPLGPPTSMPSLGYASNSSTSLDSHSMNHNHTHPPYGTRSPRSIGVPVTELEHFPQEFQEQHTKRLLCKSSSSRPSSLSLETSTAGSAMMGTRSHHQPHHQQQQFFYCPNCKKSLSCVGHASFDSWFEHMKNCNS